MTVKQNSEADADKARRLLEAALSKYQDQCYEVSDLQIGRDHGEEMAGAAGKYYSPYANYLILSTLLWHLDPRHRWKDTEQCISSESLDYVMIQLDVLCEAGDPNPNFEKFIGGRSVIDRLKKRGQERLRAYDSIFRSWPLDDRQAIYAWLLAAQDWAVSKEWFGEQLPSAIKYWSQLTDEAAPEKTL